MGNSKECWKAANWRISTPKATSRFFSGDSPD